MHMNMLSRNVPVSVSYQASSLCPSVLAKRGASAVPAAHATAASSLPAPAQRITSPHLLAMRPAAVQASRRVAVASTPVDFASLQFDMPDIDGDMTSIQVELGAVFNDEGRATTFKNPGAALQSVETGVALADRCHMGRLRITGPGRIAFAQQQFTSDITAVKAGQGCETLLLNPDGSMLDLVTVIVGANHLMVMTSPDRKDEIAQRFARYVLPGDGVQLNDISGRCMVISLIGPESAAIIAELGGASVDIAQSSSGFTQHQLLAFNSSAPVILSSGSGLAAPGYTLIVDESAAGEAYSMLAGKGCIPMGDDEWEAARVVNGRPAPGAELAHGYNPWEAGLQNLVSMSKGHFIGRDALESTLQQLSSSSGSSSSSSSSSTTPQVSRQLRGLSFSVPVSVGAPISSAMTVIGSVTSVAQNDEGTWVGMGYVRCRNANGEMLQLDGMSVAVAGYPASIRPIAYVTHDQSAARNGDSSAAGTTSEASSPSTTEPSSSSAPEEPQLNPWRLVVDRSMGGEAPRVARVVDLAAVQAHARAQQ